MLNSALEAAIMERTPIWGAGSGDWWDFTRSGRAKRGVGAMPAETRASDRWVENEAGVWVKRSPNTRLMAGKGLLSYPTRTNGIRNNTMLGVAAGSPGTVPTNWSTGDAGLTRTVVGSGVAFGLPYIDLRFSGTTAGTQFQVLTENNTSIAASNGQTWVSSVAGAELIAGSLTGNLVPAIGYNVNNGAGTYLTTPVQQTITLDAAGSPPTQKSGVATIANASAAYVQPFFLFTCLSGAVVDITFRIYAPQLEQGSFASPPILTSGSAAAAAGPQQVIDIGSRAAVGIGLILQIDRKALENNKFMWSLDDGSISNRLVICETSSQLRMFLSVGGVTVTDVVYDTATTGLQTYAAGVSSGFFKFRKVGGADSSPSVPGSFPSTITKEAFSGRSYAADANSYHLTKRAANWYGPMSQHFFDNVLWPKAQLLAQVA